MRVSIIITTYNGSKHIKEQLDSIQNQDYSIDEVIILDDKSTDNTPSIIKDYIKQHKLSSWKFIENPKQLGWRENFIKGFNLSTGDLIFPCDQDDIWHFDKISSMISVIVNNSKIEMLASNYQPFFQDNAKEFVRNYKNDNTLAKIRLSKNNIYNLRPGCSMCFKRTFYDAIYPRLWNNGLAHDEYLWKAAMLKESLYILNKNTIDYRRHSNNVTIKIHDSISERKLDIKSNKDFFEKCVKYEEFKPKARQISYKVYCFYRKREEFFNTPTLLNLFRIIPYLTYYKTTRNFLGDIVYYFRPQFFHS